MRKKVEFELLSPVMCGGIRSADNFLESESFIRGSVIRAAFANDILLECPLADQPGENGRLNYIEEKDPSGKCLNCPNHSVCKAFSDMYFSFAYPRDSLPAPFTTKVCKNSGTKHRLQDTVVQRGRLSCPDCTDGLKRMESLKGLISCDESGYSSVRVNRVLTTHTAINYDTHTAEDGKLFTVKAIAKGLTYTAEIDDCGTGMVQVGKIIYVGKYSSAGFGKMKIVSVTDLPEITEAKLQDDIHGFQNEMDAPGKAAILFLSDAILDFRENSEPLAKSEYMKLWHDALFGCDDSSVKVDKVFAETQLYSGFNTSVEWGAWDNRKPVKLILKGTSVLIDIEKESAALETLVRISETGIGQRTRDGFGAVAICHKLHRLGVYDNGQNI